MLTIAAPPSRAMSNAMTTNVYGRRKANLTIHIFLFELQRPGPAYLYYLLRLRATDDAGEPTENSPFERPSQAKKRARSIAKLFDGRKVNRFVWRACCPACNSRTLEICLGADGAVTIWCAALR